MKISIIIPAHNEEKIIEKTLRTISKKVETIVVCNGCTDNTAKISRKYAKVLIQNEANVSKARNYGAFIANGDILIFLDADTKLTKNTLKSIKEAVKHSVVGTCKVKPSPSKIKYKLIMAFKNRLLHLNWSSGLIFCKKEVFNDIQGFNELMIKKETSNFFKKSREYGNFAVANSYIISSMRRFEKWGIIKNAWYWIYETIKPSNKEYDPIR